MCNRHCFFKNYCFFSKAERKDRQLLFATKSFLKMNVFFMTLLAGMTTVNYLTLCHKIPVTIGFEKNEGRGFAMLNFLKKIRIAC